jgi:hypothetical protein
MFLNEEFLSLYEELSELNEAKADTQNLINFAGEDLANRFLAIKNKLKSPENDLYYWIKNKTPKDLETAVNTLENTKSNTKVKKDIASEGAILVCDTEHWKVYRIKSFKACQQLGRDTKWCITGINNYGNKYFKEYSEVGIDFYFLITKDKYDHRGTNSKFAIADYSNVEFKKDSGLNMLPGCEAYDQQDNNISIRDIPYIEEVSIPGVTLKDVLIYVE